MLTRDARTCMGMILHSPHHEAQPGGPSSSPKLHLPEAVCFSQLDSILCFLSMLRVRKGDAELGAGVMVRVQGPRLP
jgi:hypothetical protein